MTRPTLEQAREAIRQIAGTRWPSEAVKDAAVLSLIADGHDKAASVKAVHRAWDMYFEIWGAN